MSHPDLTSANLASRLWRKLNTNANQTPNDQCPQLTSARTPCPNLTVTQSGYHSDANSPHQLYLNGGELYHPVPHASRSAPPLLCMSKRKVWSTFLRCAAEIYPPQSIPGSNHDRLKRLRQDDDPCTKSSCEVGTDVSMVREFLTISRPHPTVPLSHR